MILTNSCIFFELLFQQSLLDDLASTDADKINLAQNIVIHELFHCKEFFIASQHVNWQNLYESSHITTTKTLLLNTAFQQWSEYYAYYHSSKTYTRNIKLSHYISKADVSLELLHNEFTQKPYITDIQIPSSFITNITDFIHRCVMFVAHYNSTNHKKYQMELGYIHKSNRYNRYYPYLIDLACYMDNLYSTYPKWVSETAYIELGRKLFGFIAIHNLAFVTEDLSDNFRLREI